MFCPEHKNVRRMVGEWTNLIIQRVLQRIGAHTQVGEHGLPIEFAGSQYVDVAQAPIDVEDIVNNAGGLDHLYLLRQKAESPKRLCAGTCPVSYGVWMIPLSPRAA